MRRDTDPFPTDPEAGYAATTTTTTAYYHEYNNIKQAPVWLQRGQADAAVYHAEEPRPFYYSVHCVLCYCVDGLVLIAVLAFLAFSLYLAYYALSNYG